jgi:FdhD protein
MAREEHRPMNTEQVDIIRYTGGKTEALRDTVVREDWLDLYVNGVLLLQAPVSTGEVEALIHGFLYAEGYLPPGERLTLSRRDTAWYTQVQREVKAVTMKELVDCAASKIEFGEEIEALPPGSPFSAQALLALAKAFQQLPSLYHSTGGVHMAAFAARRSHDHAAEAQPQPADQGPAQRRSAPPGTAPDAPPPEAASGARILYSADDISRRNAVDKVIGKVVLAHSPEGGGGGTDKGHGEALRRRLSEGLLLVSGRLSSDITVRALRTGIPLILSKSAPTEMAIRIAAAYGLTLCGFARGRRMNIYSHSERLRFD